MIYTYDLKYDKYHVNYHHFVGKLVQNFLCHAQMTGTTTETKRN
jgi:hypothetical protein